MKTISNILVALIMSLSFTACQAQIKNAKTETLKIYGNCGMCKSTIEKAGNIKKVSSVEWNKETKMATITYNSKKTSQEEILKRIALAGYDSDNFLAPDNAYSKLPGCCQYERVKKTAVKTEDPKMKMDSTKIHPSHTEAIIPAKQDENQMTAVFDNYFELKDALVKTDGSIASAKSTKLLTAIKAVKMETLPMDVHMVWMKIVKDLNEDTQHISDTKDVAHQREHFISLSKNMYTLMKVAKYEQAVYYQFCPMANDGKGANWLSKENEVKNPYYGSQMLSCGKTVETIK
jgi:copper chaperone CopZ